MLVFMATPIEKAGKIKVKPIQQKYQPRLRSTTDLTCASASRHYSVDSQMAPVKRSDDTSLSSARSSVTSNSSSISDLSRSCSLSETDKKSPIMKKPRVKLKRTQPVLRTKLRQPVIEKPMRVVSDYIEGDEFTIPQTIKTPSLGNENRVALNNVEGDNLTPARTSKAPSLGNKHAKRHSISNRVDSDSIQDDELTQTNKAHPQGKHAKKRHSLSSVMVEQNLLLRTKRSNSTGSVLDLPPQSFKSSLKRLGSAQNLLPSKSVSFRVGNRSPRIVHQRTSRTSSFSTPGRVINRSVNKTASSPNRFSARPSSVNVKSPTRSSASPSRSVSVKSTTRPSTSPSRSVSVKSPTRASTSPSRSVNVKSTTRPSTSPSRSVSVKSPTRPSTSPQRFTHVKSPTRPSTSPQRSVNVKSTTRPSTSSQRSVSYKGSLNRLSPGSSHRPHSTNQKLGIGKTTNRHNSSGKENLMDEKTIDKCNTFVKGNLMDEKTIDKHNTFVKENSMDEKTRNRRHSFGNQNSVDEIAQYVIKQCRIGSDVAFGLVHVVNKDNNDSYNDSADKKKPTSNGFTDGHGLVTIRMKPDEQGRFGFNVKGGADQGMPIIVSRVAPNTPADLSIPRLNEGDQVLFINGRDMSQHTHEQVVMFIKASRETHSGELVVMVRPNVYVGEDLSDEPDFSYTPETHTIASSNSTNTLQSSLLLLQESLDSGAALAQFEQLYRKKPNMSMNSARLECNIAKNRYRDISPYDQTRVILKGSSSGDYVNANFVNMEIPGSGIVNRYIAAQGPLQNTCTDFWQMVWEQHCTLVVMLTTKVERGRVKCHQYWPELYETQDFGALQITCVKEEDTTSFAFREFNLTHVETNEERHIRHMQYISWPDHGVPDDPGDFLQFVVRVRQSRAGMVEPTVVHCSAGIGRTGVLITMETAMCLIEANQPCFPLQIVKNMRDQRAMLIQTPSQYKFVCEAILRVYHEGIVKPVDDFQR